MIRNYKDEFIYLFLLSIVTYLGAYFSASLIEFSVGSFSLKLLPHLLLLLNSFVIYFLSMNFSGKKKISFLISSLYLLSPTHTNDFLFFHLIQATLAESALIFSLLFYYLKQTRKAFVFLVSTAFLNTKLILLYPFFFYFNKTSKWEKAFASTHSLITLIYIIPFFIKNQSDFLFKPNTIFYIFEMLFLPLKRSIIDFSQVVPDYHTRMTLIAFTILAFVIGIYYLKKENPLGKMIAVFIFTSIFSTFIPFREWIVTGDYSFYFNATFYPVILLGFLGSLMLLALYKEKLTLVFMGYLCISWFVSNIFFQKNTLDVVNNWSETIFSLPSTFHKEEEIKMQYVKVLMKNNENFKAETVVNETRLKFPKEIWYDLALDFAKKRKDSTAIEKIRKDLIRYQVPFQVD